MVNIFERLESGFSEGTAYIYGMGNGVSLPDGGVGVIFGAVNDRTAPVKSKSQQRNLFFAKYPSQAGSWTDIQKISQWVKDTASTGTGIPQMAIDRSTSPFKNNLYAVWADRRSGRVRIMMSYSRNLGMTWSQAEEVDDSPSLSDPNQHADLANPALAVNGFGVVAVSWLDRRRDSRNLDWDYRIAVSLDGGETFSKSVVVSSAGSHFGGNEEWNLNVGRAERSETGDIQIDLRLDGFFDNSGHTVGMTADGEGAFHPFWADNRTGRPQIWTTTVQAEGNVRSFDPGADLQDMSDSLKVEVSDQQFDRKTNVLNIALRLRNTGQRRIRRKVVARVRSISSQIGNPAVLDSINGLQGINALIDLSDVLDGEALEPNQVSKEKRIRFQIDRANPFVADDALLLKYGVLMLRLRLYAAVSP